MADKAEKESPVGLSSFFKVRDIVGYVASVAITGIVSWFTIWRRLGTNFHEMVDKGIVKAPTLEPMKNLFSDLDSKKISLTEFPKKLGKLYAENEHIVQNFWKEKGVKWYKLQGMSPHQRLEVIFSTVATLTVSLGVILSVTKSKEFGALMHRGDQKRESQVQVG